MGCMNHVKPRVLEVSTLIFTAIGIGFYVWGIVDIPWDDISKAGKGFFILGGLFFGFSSFNYSYINVFKNRKQNKRIS